MTQKIDTTKPLEVVANWDSSLVWKAEFVKADEDGDILARIIEDHRLFRSGRNFSSGRTWWFRGKMGLSTDLTIRNVAEPEELTWENCPQWAKDEAFRRASELAGYEIGRHLDLGPFGKNLALMIAKHEKPPEEERSLVVALEEAKRFSDGYEQREYSPAVKAAKAAYERGLQDGRAE